MELEPIFWLSIQNPQTQSQTHLELHFKNIYHLSQLIRLYHLVLANLCTAALSRLKTRPKDLQLTVSIIQ